MRPDSSVHWSAYPALLVACAFGLGVAAESFWAARAVWFWLGGAGVGVGLFVGTHWWARTRLVTLAPLGRIAAVVLVVVCAGGARHALYRLPASRSLAPAARASNEATTLQGAVVDAPERTGETTRFTLSVDSILPQRDTAAVDGRTRVTLRPSPWEEDLGPFPTVRQGDVLRLRGALQTPPGLRNPGGFDYAAYLARRGVCCTMYVGTPDRVTVIGNRRGVVGASLVAVRVHIRRQIERFVPSAGGRAVLQALLLGDRSRVTDAQRDRFAKTGLMHLLAVSGLHVFLVGMVLYALLRPLLMRLRLQWRTVEGTRAVFTIVVLGFYMLLTGGRPSVVRAVIMATLFIGGIFFQRSAHSLNTLGVAALVLLAMRPPALFDVGFQLSMAAVAGIVTLNPRFLGMVPEWCRESKVSEWVVSSTTVSAAAILGTAPVLLYHFGWVSAAGVLLNIVGIPCTGLALTAAILMATLGALGTMVGAAFGSAADLFVQGLLLTSRYGAEWFAWAGIRMPVPDPWLLGALLASLVALAQWPRPRHRWRWIVGAFFLATVSVWDGAVGRSAGPTLDVVSFDVGQGGATLIRTPEERHVLVDTGPRSPEGSAAQFAILPYLERWGIRRLHTVVITHPDEDHLGGLPTLLREVPIGRVVRSGRTADTELYEEVQRLIQRKSVPQRIVRRGDTLALGSSVRAQVLSPPPRRDIESRNNASVVLHLSYGEVDALFPGDVEFPAEQNLVRAYGSQLESRIVKVPHHGSSTSSSPSFVQRVSDGDDTSYAVVSVGREEQYGMPDSQVIARWKSHGMKVRSTAQAGAVWLSTDGQKVWEKRWRLGLLRKGPGANDRGGS
ncbi:MAG: DNA internalization-related competence protein ComEC/Rec2 [Salinibacter sp.]